MTNNTDNSNTSIFWIEFAMSILMLFIICWALIPTNVLNSNFLYKELESVGVGGLIVMLFFSIPIGIIGIKKARVMDKYRIPTTIFSIINLSFGIIEILLLILIFCAVIFGGVTH